MDARIEFKAFLLEIVYQLTESEVKAMKFLLEGRTKQSRLDKADHVDFLKILHERGFWSWNGRRPGDLDQFATLCQSIQRMDLSNKIMEHNEKYEDQFLQPPSTNVGQTPAQDSGCCGCAPVFKTIKAGLVNARSERAGGNFL